MKMQELLDKVKKDCLKLKKAGYLTEYGQGQLDLIKIIKGGGIMVKEKYSMNDLMKLSKDARLAKVGLIIANELHSIRSVLQTIVRNKK